MLIAILAVVIILSIAVWIWSNISVKESILSVSEEDVHFPLVSGSNLMREEFEFPRDFEGKYNLVIIPFKQVQQRDVNTWIPAAQELERRFTDLVYYELPTIYRMPTLSRTFINEGMRAGIPDQLSRERTITLYLEKKLFKQALDIDTEDTIHLFLVDQQGIVLWRDQGLFSESKANSLINTLEQIQ